MNTDKRFTETYEEWREREGIMPDQDVRYAWNTQQEKINDLLATIDEMSKVMEEMDRFKTCLVLEGLDEEH